MIENIDFGVKTPAALDRIITDIIEISLELNQKPEFVFEKCFGIAYFGGEELRCQQTPPELFPFASLGVDGEHYGYIYYGNDLISDDYLVGALCPMDSDGAWLLGKNTIDAFCSLLFLQMEFSDDDDSNEIRNYVYYLKKKGIVPNKQSALFNRSGEFRRVKPNLRSDYKFINTSDGIGVYTDIKYHSNDRIIKYDTGKKEIDDYFIEKAKYYYNKSFYATSLYYLKELLWNSCSSDDLLKEVSEKYISIYQALKRDELAEIVCRNITKYSIT